MNKIIYTTVLKENTPIHIILLVCIEELIAYVQRTIIKPYYKLNIRYPKIVWILGKLIPKIPERYIVLEE